MTKSIMQIKDYEVWVSLGCSEAEQSLSQPVLFNIEIQFDSIVSGETTDQLSDAIDYVVLTDLLKQSAVIKSYQLIEHMCLVATQSIVDYLTQKNVKGSVKVNILKLRAPVPNLKSGVSWTCLRQL
jgi:FolB domain-containing protein